MGPKLSTTEERLHGLEVRDKNNYDLILGVDKSMHELCAILGMAYPPMRRKPKYGPKSQFGHIADILKRLDHVEDQLTRLKTPIKYTIKPSVLTGFERACKYVKRHPGCSSADLCAHLGRKTHNFTNFMAPLEKQGRVRRVYNKKDGTIRWSLLTP